MYSGGLFRSHYGTDYLLKFLGTGAVLLWRQLLLRYLIKYYGARQ